MKGDERMIIVHVFVRVKPDCVHAFKIASCENAKNSLQESGVGRFDVIQQQDDPTRFVLVEAYRTESDTAKHKQTVHYQTWRDTVADMMAEPRSSIRYVNVFPDDRGWG
jgi:autoinducer 2-degrading protein